MIPSTQRLGQSRSCGLANTIRNRFVARRTCPCCAPPSTSLSARHVGSPRRSLGNFPVRFPSSEKTGDTGWHVDASFPGDHSDPNNFLTWHINLRSRGRALLMLFLFSDVGEEDAPTRIRAGSHLEVARILEPAGEADLPVIDLNPPAGHSEAVATGQAGTVYLCHPISGARGSNPSRDATAFHGSTAAPTSEND